MRKINLKVLFGLLVGVVVCTGSLFAVHYFQSRRIADALLWQARKAEDNNEIDRVVRYLGRYLEFQPGDVEERARLGRALLSEHFANSVKARRRGIDQMETVLRTNPERDEDRRLLIKAALEIRRNKIARDSLEMLWKVAEKDANLKPTVRGELESYWGQLVEAEGRAEEAITWYREAKKHAPTDQLNYVRLAYLLREQADPNPNEQKRLDDEANAIMDELVKNNAESPEAHLSRWRYRRGFDLIRIPGSTESPTKMPLDDAAQDVITALKQAPESLDVLLAGADMERLRNRRHIAEDLLIRGLEINKNLGKKASGSRHHIQLLWQLTNVLLDNGITKENKQEAQADVAEAIKRIQHMRKIRGAGAAADYLQGRLLLQEQKWGEAVSLLERSRSMLQRKPELVRQIDLYLGRCYDKLEEPSQMYEAYQRVASTDPSSTVARLGMASALWTQGRLDEAMTNYIEVMKQDKVPENGWLEIARLEVTRQLRKEEPDRNWDLARKALANADKMTPRSVPVTLLRAEILIAENKPDEAEALLQKAKIEKPKREVDLWAALSELALRQDQPDKALTILDEAEKALGDRPQLRLTRVRHHLRTKSKKVAEVLERAGQDYDKFDEFQKDQLLEGLAQAHFELKEFAKARRLCEKLVELPQHQADLRLRLFLFDLALKADDEPGMKATLETINRLEQGQGAYYRYGRALHMLWIVKKQDISVGQKSGYLDRARRELEEAARERPSWPPIHLARAEIFDLEGNPEQAILELRRAIQKGENSPAIIQRLVRALLAQGRENEADRELKHLRRSLLINSELGRLASRVALRKGDTARALQLARDAIPDGSTDIGGKLWSAKVKSAAGKISEAERDLRDALKSDPSNPNPWVALVRFLVENKRRAEAEATIRQAADAIEKQTRPLALAQCYEVIGQFDRAMKYHEEAVKARPKDITVLRSVVQFFIRRGRIPDAEMLLRTIVSDKVPAKQADKAWARRGLALILADGTDYTRFREAIELVGLKLDAKGHLDLKSLEGKAPTELQRTRARVLATQAPRIYRNTAISLFELLERGQALQDDDRLVLALLYERAGAWDKARAKFLELVVPKAEQPRFLVKFIEGLIAQRELIGIEPWLKQLEALEKEREVEPGTFGSVELRALVFEKQGKNDEAAALLKSHIERAGAPKTDLVLLIKAMVRQKKYDEAVSLCDRAWETCPAPVAGAVSVAVLRAMEADDSTCQKLQSRLEKAIGDAPKEMVLQMHLAQIQDLRGHYRGAEKTYRLILKKENQPNNIVALNNLAWMLALRKGQEKEALALITRAINGYGRRAELLDTRGLIYITLGRTKEAISDLEEAVADKASAVRLYHLALAYHQARDMAKARKTIEDAKRAGLRVERLHPVEQKNCKSLLADSKL